MKKIFSIISTIVLATTVCMLTSCEAPRLAPEDEWCEKTYEYENGSGDAYSLDVYFYYASKDKEINFGYNTEDTSSPKKATLKKGLNIVIAPDSSSDNDYSDIFGTVTGDRTPIYLQSYEEGNSVDIEDSDGNTTAFSMSYTAWNLIYFCNTMDDSGTPDFARDTKTKYEDFESVSSLTENFSWKKLLKKIALNKLTDLLTD